ncbi:hypothetical protein GIB67_000701 [Kingdonia uniflora]|uniref:No apical meristem-associated C-terminal domain-containing protein n=1 Tax=Kingdonia uniflora TaxID=39325 RepID=A0A7J7ND93_9MAGN|nr:hypothetical protein GIB67_000701 [Kingdonia uniflora]
MRQYLLKQRRPIKKKKKEERKEHPQNKDKACKCQKMLSFWTRWMMVDCIGLKQTLRVTRAWVTTSVQTMGRTKGFTFYQKVNIAFNKNPEYPTRRSSESTKSQWYTLNSQCVAYKGIVAQERFRHDSEKTEEDRENDAHKIYQGLNGGNDFKHCEAYKILAREPRWANLNDNGLNHAENIPRNVARRTSNNSSLGNSVGSNNLSEDPDGPPTPQSAGPNSELDSSFYEGRSNPIGQQIFRKNFATQKAFDDIVVFGSGIQTMLDKLRLEKR